MPTYTKFRIKIKRGYNMWSDNDLLDTIKMFLPPTSKIVLFGTELKKNSSRAYRP